MSTIYIITSAKDVVFLGVCLFVSIRNNSKRNYWIFLTLFMWVGPDQRKKLLNFEEPSDHLWTKKNLECTKVPFSVNAFAFVFNITLV